MRIQHTLHAALKSVVLALGLAPAISMAAATINLSFSPATINPGDASSINISVYNSAFNPLTSTAITVNLASGVTLSSNPTVTDSCGFTSVSAAANASNLILSGGTVPSGVSGVGDGSCTISVPVNSVSTGNHTTTLPANGPSNGFTAGGNTAGFSADDNGSTISNGTAASATLAVNSIAVPTGTVAFSPTSAYVGETSALSLTLSNPNAGVTLPLSSFTFSLPSGMTLSSSTGSVSCTGNGALNGLLSSPSVPGFLSVGDSSITLSSGVIGNGGNCVIQLSVKAPSTTGGKTLSVGAGAVGNWRGLSNLAFSGSLTVNSPLSTPTQTITNNVIRVGQSTPLVIKLSNASGSNAMTITNFTDNLSGGLVMDSSTTPSSVCTGTGAANGTVTASAGGTSIVLSGATAGPNGNCQITVGVLMGAKGTGTSTVATTQANGTQITTPVITPSLLTVNASSANLTAESGFTLSKSVSDTTAYPGQALTYTVTVSNWSSGAATQVNFSDTLPTAGGVPMLLSAGSAIGSGCSGGSVTANADTDTFTWAGGTIAAGSGTAAGTCQITILATMPSTATVGSTYTNSLPNGTAITGKDSNNNSINNNGGASVGSNTIASASVTQAFSPTTINQGSTSTLTLTLTNPTATPLTSVNFTETMDSNLVLAASPTIATTCSGTLVSSGTAGSSTFGVSGLTVPANNGTCKVTLKVTSLNTSTGSGWAATFNAGDLHNAELLTNSASGTGKLKVTGALGGSASFSPSSVGLNGITRMTVALSNASTMAWTNVSMTAPMQAGTNAFVVAPTPNASTTCLGSPTLTANAGASSVSLAGATLAGSASCAVSFDVQTTAGSSWTFTLPIGNLSSAEGATNTNSITANASNALSASAAFLPTSTGLSGNSRLSLTLSNQGSVALNNVSLISPMQTGSTAFVLATPANASSTCAGSPVITAADGANTLSMSGASLAAGGSCTLSFDITTTAITSANWTYTLPANAITTTEGAGIPSSVTASLSKVTGSIGINKSFSPISIVGGSSSVLQIDLTNPSGGSTTVNAVSLTDSFPSGMEVSATPNAHTNCTNGVVSATAGGGSLSFAGADIAVGSTCSVFVDVTSIKPLNLTNTIAVGAVKSRQGFTNSLATSASLSTLQGVGVEKSFSPAAVAPGQASKLTVKLISTLNTVNLSNVSLTDTLPSGMVVAGTPNLGGTCNVYATASAGANAVTVSGVNLAAQSNCSLTVDVVASSAGTYTNTIAIGAVTSAESYANTSASSATLLVLNPPTVGVAFGTTPMQAGATSSLTFTVTNNSSQSLTGLALSNVLPSGLSVALTPNPSTTCTGGSVAASAAGTTVAITGASLNANASCSFKADVTTNTSGSYVQNVATSAVSTAQGVTNTAASSATLVVLQFPTLTQALSPNAIVPNGSSTLTLTLGNSNASAITLSSALNVSLPTLPGNLLLASPNGLSKTCPGTVTATAGTGSLTYASGASIPTGGCTISVNLTASALGTYTNTIAAGALQTSAGNTQTGSSVSLSVSNSQPPVASNLSLTVLNNIVSAQSVGPLSATAVSPATVSTYTLRSLPASNLGSLFCNGVNVSSVPSTCAANQLSFMPASNAVGTGSFTYSATDSNGNESSNATVSLTVWGLPTANAVTLTLNNDASVPVAVGPLSGTAQGSATLSAYTLTSLPGASLRVYCNAVLVSTVPSACAANQLTVLPQSNPSNPVSFNYTVSDSNNQVSAAATVTVSFNTPPVAQGITNAAINNSVSTAQALTPLSASVSTSGATISAYKVSSLPASGTLYCSGVALSTVPSACAANALSYKPLSNGSGSVSFQYTATDSNGMGSSPATVTIPLNAAPTANAVSNTAIRNTVSTAQALNALSATVNTVGATITGYNITSLPSSGTLFCSGLAINTVPSVCAANGLSYLPASNGSGTVSFQYTATDSNGMSSPSATVSIPVNTAPVAQDFSHTLSNNLLTAASVGPMFATAQAGASIVSYTVISLPSNATLSCAAQPVTAVPATCAANGLSVLPNNTPIQPSTWSYQATDSNGMVSATATATVNWTAKPVANPFSFKLSSGGSAAQALSVLSGTPTTLGSTLVSYQVSSLPPSSKGTLYCQGSALSSVPASCPASGLSFLPANGANGTSSFAYTVTDSLGQVSAPATVTLTLSTLPLANNLSMPATSVLNTQAVPLATLSGSATTPGSTVVTYTLRSLPASGELSCQGTLITGIPAVCAPDGLGFKPAANSTGSLSFTYTVTDSDGLVSASATVTLPLNTPPVAQAILNTAINNTVGTAQALLPMSATVSTAGATISGYSVSTLPSSGTLSCGGTPLGTVPASCAATGLSYLPVSSASGHVVFQYTAIDSNGLSSAPVSFTIPLNTPPVANAVVGGPYDNALSTLQAVPDLSGTVTTAGATLSTFTLTTLPSASMGTAYCAGTALSTTPVNCAPNGLSVRLQPGTAGPLSMSYVVRDSNGQVSAPASITLNLTGSPALGIVKTSQGVMTVGFDATYQLQVSNKSAYTATQGVVTVTDVLPAGLDFQTAAGNALPSSWNCSWTESTRQVQCSSSAVIAPNSDAETITLHVKANDAAVSGQTMSTLSNTATVAGGGELPGYANGSATGAQPHSSTVTQTVQKASLISGSAWLDLNGNGMKDPGEPTLDAGSVIVQVWPAGTTAAQAAVGTPLVSTTIDTAGQYAVAVPPGNMQVRFVDAQRQGSMGSPVNGETSATRNQSQATGSSGVPHQGVIDHIAVAPGATITQQSLPIDPQGYVYDSGTRKAVGGATVTLTANNAPVPTDCLAGGSNPFVTASSGALAGSYQFLVDFTPAACASLSGATFHLNVSAAGYRFPSALIPNGMNGSTVYAPPAGTGAQAIVDKVTPPQVADPTTHYLAVVLRTGFKGIINNHLPVDGSKQGALQIAKMASRASAEIGDLVRYTVTVRNTGTAVLPPVRVHDRLPLGFKLVDPSTTLSVAGGPAAALPVVSGSELDFHLPGMAPGAVDTLQYLVRIGVGGDKGDGINRVRAQAGAIQSSEASAKVQVSGGVFGSAACLAGKVFQDHNGNGVQDKGELGVPRVRLWLETGVSMTTDALGEFSYCGLTPRTHTIKLDRSTMPTGWMPTLTSHRNLGDPDSLLLDVKNGELIRADFALMPAGAASDSRVSDPPRSDRPGRTRVQFESLPSAKDLSHD